MTNFFPINENTFVDFCMRDIRAIGLDSWMDTYHQHIDHEVDNNSYEENIMIINEYVPRVTCTFRYGISAPSTKTFCGA